jgi:hypothetical protein
MSRRHVTVLSFSPLHQQGWAKAYRSSTTCCSRYARIYRAKTSTDQQSNHHGKQFRTYIFIWTLCIFPQVNLFFCILVLNLTNCIFSQIIMIPDDVGITLRVTSIVLPLAAQPGGHEEYPSTKVGRCVGSKGGVLTSKAKIRRNKKSLDIRLFVT